MKKGQISIEILYAVSVILILFSILTVMELERKQDVRRMEDFLKKRGECFKLSTLIAGASSTGDVAIYDYYSPYETIVESTGFINIRNLNKTNSLEVFCSFHAALSANKTLNPGI